MVHLQLAWIVFYITKTDLIGLNLKLVNSKITLKFCLISPVLNTIDAFISGVNPASKVSTIVERVAAETLLQIHLKYWSVL